jgi:Asp-tRNA(Asn)/Glu-tRNA(Gln) amidotransferase A subunit family amidase
MQAGTETSRSLVEKYLARIDAIDRGGPALHSVIEINPDALAIADRCDTERKSRGPRGPLHGFPILLNQNRIRIRAGDETPASADVCAKRRPVALGPVDE